ncbi:GH25 family lysozyme [Paludicola sp. MB14-C6]|uniref:GH25 family lysozyme n=1 Tax=Paludihabitans sp. MB14-C6 TaxID=3070656 RepID=UPI0027DCD847|nr:GH25 family lysozyme [Paludicola sp. MB14-C6]WMJ22974.1 GH25 family lysozyme [Paludicola sp. MB14-C6]
MKLKNVLDNSSTNSEEVSTEGTVNLSATEIKSDSEIKPLDPLQKKRKKIIQLIIWISVAIFVVLMITVGCFFISKKKPVKDHSSSVKVVNLAVHNSSTADSQSKEQSSNPSSTESQSVSSKVNTTVKVVKPSTGKVTTAPEFKYKPAEDVAPKKNEQAKEVVDKNDDNTIVSITPVKGTNSSQVSSTTSSIAGSTKTVVMALEDNVNTRTGPATTFSTVGKMVKGQEYSFIGEEKAADGTLWYHIQYDGSQQSWVTSQYAEKKEKAVESSSANSSSASNATSQYQLGWNSISGKDYYYDGSSFVKGWANIGGFRYYFDETTGAKRSSVGIDVSKYQGTINWNAVKAAGVDYAFIRVGFRGYGSGSISIDPTFVTNIVNANKAGVKCGVYFYSTAASEAEGAEEASFVLNAISGYRVDLPIVIDVEHRTDRVAGLTSAQRTDYTLAFLNTIKNAGKTGMLYTGHYFYQNYLESSRLKDYPLWIAYYTNSEKNVADVPYTYWQYSSTGTVNGISGSVDLNIKIN